MKFPITLGLKGVTVQKTVEAFMETIKDSLVDGENVYLRGFGSMIIKKRGRKNCKEHIKKHIHYYSCT